MHSLPCGNVRQGDGRGRQYQDLHRKFYQLLLTVFADRVRGAYFRRPFMTELHDVSIDEVRALVAERQRFDDWLTALDGRRAETPVRVFERVQADYVARRREVMDRLREHVGGLASSGEALESRLATLESQLSTLEDERAEAMLRTAVGEYDSDRWEQVRQNVETQIGELGEQRSALLAEVDEVRTLLSSARAEPEGDAAASANDAPVEAASVEAVADVEPTASAAVDDAQLTDAVSVETEYFDGPHGATAHELAPMHTTDFLIPTVEPMLDVERTAEHSVAAANDAAVSPQSSNDELADLDNALALFSADAPADPYGQATNPLNAGLDGVDVFDDAELGDLRMSPPVTSTATVTPHSAPASPSNSALNPSENARDGFDDLAFLRSVVDPSAQSAASRAPTAGDQQKTLRCTECGTMNFPTEWYCERCGGELAAF